MYVNIYFWKLMLTGWKTMSSKLLCQGNTYTNFNKSVANIISNNLNLRIIKFMENIFMEVDAKLEEKPNISTNFHQDKYVTNLNKSI